MKTLRRISTSILCLLTLVSCMLVMTSCVETDIACMVGMHEWGEWTEVQKATCVSTGIRERACVHCGEAETAIAEDGTHVPEMDDGDCTTQITCVFCNELITPASEGHIGGESSCSSPAICTVCGTGYGELEAHTPSDDDGDCTTDIPCDVCGGTAVPGNAAHTGGTATCENKAVCDVCGVEYGELAAHAEETVWVKSPSAHYRAYACCMQQAAEAEAHTMVNGVCTTCGFKLTLEIASAEVTAEDAQVVISVSIQDNPGIAGLMISVQYSSEVFTLTAAESGEAMEALMFTSPGTLASGSRFLWDGVDVQEQDIRDGECLKLTFAIAPDAPAGEYSILLNVTAYDNALNPLTPGIAGGKITIAND